MKRGQTSVEFLSIFGFVFLMTIPLIMIFFDQSGHVQDSISENQLRNTALRMVDKAETIYYLGGSSRTTIKAYFPDNIELINITSRAVVIRYATMSGITHDVVAFSQVNLTGSLSTNPGIHYIVLEAGDGEVQVSEG